MNFLLNPSAKLIIFPQAAASNSYGGPRGRVGPVYTFVKTDPEANFKWGVRHVAGSQYGKWNKETVERIVE